MNEIATSTRTAGAVEKVMLQGDISGLSPQERVSYYGELCAYLGLNPVTQPFKFLKLQGKEILYASKDATEQLRKINGVSIDSMDGKQVGDVYIATVKGHDKSGRTDVATGAVTVAGLKGDALANSLMKAETKAKRRLTLSICGLGVLDETEIETIPGAKPVDGPTVTVDLQPQNGNWRAPLYKRAKDAVDTGMLTDGEVTLYRKECRDAQDRAQLEALVDEMEKAVAAARKLRETTTEEPEASPEEQAEELF